MKRKYAPYAPDRWWFFIVAFLFLVLSVQFFLEENIFVGVLFIVLVILFVAGPYWDRIVGKKK